MPDAEIPVQGGALVIMVCIRVPVTFAASSGYDPDINSMKPSTEGIKILLLCFMVTDPKKWILVFSRDNMTATLPSCKSYCSSHSVVWPYIPWLLTRYRWNMDG